MLPGGGWGRHVLNALLRRYRLTRLPPEFFWLGKEEGEGEIAFWISLFSYNGGTRLGLTFVLFQLTSSRRRQTAWKGKG